MTAHAQRRRSRSSPPVGGAVHFHIDDLVFWGVERVEAGRLARALEAKLADLAAQSGLRFVPLVAERMPAAHVVAGPVPEQTGRSIATALWSGITGAGQGGQ
jgi:hypothetical protein